MSRVLRALALLVAVFVLMPVAYELLRALMPLIFMFIGVFVFSKLMLGKFKKW